MTQLPTSYRALRTEKGFKKNPTVTLVVAPASKLPWLVRVGRMDECLVGSCARMVAKYADVAIRVRTWFRLVIYSAIPGTLLFNM